jgi:phage terminase Nu1 subunit (DNA packaging protein)
MNDGWLVGRKEIMKYLGVSWDTVRKWKREHGCPIRSTPGNRPMAFKFELVRWADLYAENKNKLGL